MRRNAPRYVSFSAATHAYATRSVARECGVVVARRTHSAVRLHARARARAAETRERLRKHQGPGWARGEGGKQGGEDNVGFTQEDYRRDFGVTRRFHAQTQFTWMHRS